MGGGANSGRAYCLHILLIKLLGGILQAVIRNRDASLDGSMV